MMSYLGIGAMAQLLFLASVAGIFQELVPPTVAQGTTSGITEPRQIVVRSAADWRALWAAHSPQPAPDVDFSRSVVAGVFLGSRPSAGFRVEITNVSIQGNRAVVQFVEHRPGSDDIVAQMLTAPFHLVALPNSVRDVSFQETKP